MIDWAERLTRFPPDDVERFRAAGRPLGITSDSGRVP